MARFSPQQHRHQAGVVAWPACVVALLLILGDSAVDKYAAGAAIINTGSRREMMQQAAGGKSTSSWLVQLMGGMKSPLSKDDAVSYAKVFKETGSVGDLCHAGKLYCDVEAYRSYYEGLLQLDGSNIQEKDVSVFFRESELVVDREVNIADPDLQSAAIEKNRLELTRPSAASHNIGMVKYNYINVAKLPERAFLPVELAQTLPFTTRSAADVFKLDPSSVLARESSKTVQICQEGIRIDGTTKLQGEAAACATSLEGLQSLLSSPMLLGSHDAANVKALTTTDSLRLHGGRGFTGKVVEVSLQANEQQRHAVCHNLMYPSAVYFCHYLPRTRVYTVALQQTHGDPQQLLRAVAMCHMDTNGWNPHHLAFQNLRTVPGRTEACHWVLQGSVTFVPDIAGN